MEGQMDRWWLEGWMHFSLKMLNMNLWVWKKPGIAVILTTQKSEVPWGHILAHLCFHGVCILLGGWTDDGEGGSKDNREHTNKPGRTRRWHTVQALRRWRLIWNLRHFKWNRWECQFCAPIKPSDNQNVLTDSSGWDLKTTQSTYYVCPAFCFSNLFPQVPEEIQMALK